MFLTCLSCNLLFFIMAEENEFQNDDELVFKIISQPTLIS